MTCACGNFAFTAVATPAISPPPDAGATTISGDEPERRHVLGDLAARGALPGDHEGIVIGAHQRRAALAGNAVGDGFAVFLVAVVEHHLGAIALGALALGEGESAGITMVACMFRIFAAAATPWA